MLSSFSKSFRNSFRKIRKNDDERRDDKRTQSMNIHRSYSTDAHIYSNSFMHCQESQNNSIIPERYLIGIVNFHSTFFKPNLSLKPGASLEKNIFSSMRQREIFADSCFRSLGEFKKRDNPLSRVKSSFSLGKMSKRRTSASRLVFKLVRTGVVQKYRPALIGRTRDCANWQVFQDIFQFFCSGLFRSSILKSALNSF